MTNFDELEADKSKAILDAELKLLQKQNNRKSMQIGKQLGNQNIINAAKRKETFRRGNLNPIEKTIDKSNFQHMGKISQFSNPNIQYSQIRLENIPGNSLRSFRDELEAVENSKGGKLSPTAYNALVERYSSRRSHRENKEKIADRNNYRLRNDLIKEAARSGREFLRSTY